MEGSIIPSCVICTTLPVIVPVEQVFSGLDSSSMLPSFVTHWSGEYQSHYSAVSCLSSSRTHYVSHGEVLPSKDIVQKSLWQRLEEQFQREQKDGCNQS